MRHTWINYPTNSKRKCTRCGVIKEINRRGNYGNKYYLNGIEYDTAPLCKDFDEPILEPEIKSYK